MGVDRAYVPALFRGEMEPATIQAYLEQELLAISRTFAEVTELELRPIFAPPQKPRDGMIVYADGTTWNPGAGEGPYSYVNGAWVKMAPMTGSLELYVRTDGNDGNNGLENTAAGAFLTIQAAFDAALQYPLSGEEIRIIVGPGTYSAGVSIHTPIAGRIVIRGDTTTPSNCVISVTGAHCFMVDYPGSILWLGGFKVVSSGGYGVYAENGGQIVVYEKMEYGNAFYQIVAASGGKIWITMNYSITGGGSHHYYSTRGGLIQVAGITITGSGAQAFSIFVNCDGVSLTSVFSTTITGAGSFTGQRYSASTNGVIYTATGNVNFFPGNVAGSVGSGGVYN